MEEKIVEVLKNYYPDETPVRDDYPTIKRIQKQIQQWRKDERITHFLHRVEQEIGEKWIFFSNTPFFLTPGFGFTMISTEAPVTYHVTFYFSILAPYYCYFVKLHNRKKEVIPPTELKEKVFHVNLSEMLRKEKINVIDHFYLDENLSSKVDALTELIIKNSDKYQLSISTWKETSMYKWMRAHADSYEEYAPTNYVNTSPEVLQNIIEFIIEKQKEYFDFNLLSAHLIEKDVLVLKPYNPRNASTFCRLLFGYDVPDKRTKLL